MVSLGQFFLNFYHSILDGRQTMAVDREKRRCPRILFENRVGYILYNQSRKKVDHGSGRTLNLSQTGVLLETEKILEGAFIILVTMDLEGKKIKVKGKVVTSRYCNDSGCFLTGVEFIGPKDEQLEAIKVFVKVHLHRKHTADSLRPVN